MKKFNLELAKKGYKVITRDGRNVRIISFDRKVPKFPIVALVDDDGVETIHTYTEDGRKDEKSKYQTNADLFMKPIKMEGWINIYADGTTGINIYCSKHLAMLNIDETSDYVETIKIKWEEPPIG